MSLSSIGSWDEHSVLAVKYKLSSFVGAVTLFFVGDAEEEEFQVAA